MRKVMLALDYDPTAQKIAETGFALAQLLNAEVILLHVIADPVYYSSAAYSPIMGFTGYTDADTLQQDPASSLEKASQHFLDEFKKQLGDEKIRTLVANGDLAGSILTAAKETDADIIVMGSHSRRWLEAIVMGSVTEKVLHHTTIPLFIIPTKQKK